MKFTINTITAKANHIHTAFDYNVLCGLAQNPDAVCNDTLKKYHAINNNKINKKRFNFAVRNEFYAGWANVLNLKCRPESLNDFIGQEIVKNGQKTKKIITKSLIASLTNSEKQGAFSLFFADIDKHNFTIENVKNLVNKFFRNLNNTKHSDQHEYLIYATKSATEDNKRWRVIIPISGLIGLEIFQVGQKLLQETLNADNATALNAYQSFLLPLIIDNNYMENSYYAYYSPSFINNFYLKPSCITAEILNHYLGESIKERETKKIETPKIQLMEKKTRQQNVIDGTQLIYKFNTEVTTESILNTHGFVISSPKNGKRHVSKQGSRGFDGSSCIFENSGKFKTFKTESPLYNDGKAMGSFDLFRILECGGDYGVAYREARKMIT